MLHIHLRLRAVLPEGQTDETWEPSKSNENQGELDRKVKKGKAIPLQAWTGPEGSRRLRLPYFMTTGT